MGSRVDAAKIKDCRCLKPVLVRQFEYVVMDSRRLLVKSLVVDAWAAPVARRSLTFAVLVVVLLASLLADVLPAWERTDGLSGLRISKDLSNGGGINKLHACVPLVFASSMCEASSPKCEINITFRSCQCSPRGSDWPGDCSRLTGGKQHGAKSF
jgi:hypothetical protein